MRKLLVVFALAGISLFQYCSTAKKAQAAPMLTYEANVHPIIMNSCSPCHTGGKQKPLNSYAAASAEIEEIITRIQKNPGEKGFMPFKHPKLADSTIAVFVQWKNAGMPAN